MGKAAKKIEWPLAMSILESLEKQGRKRELMMVALGLFSAYRCSDWSKLKWGDITDKIRMKEQKTKKIREVALHPELNRIRALCAGKEEDFIFTPLRGGTGKTLATGGCIKILRKVGLEFGIPDLSTHSLRKSWAFRAYESMGKTEDAIIKVSMMLNHRSLVDTYRYLGIQQSEFDLIYTSI